jgi:hypothetical protein
MPSRLAEPATLRPGVLRWSYTAAPKAMASPMATARSCMPGGRLISAYWLIPAHPLRVVEVDRVGHPGNGGTHKGPWCQEGVEDLPGGF